MNLVFYSMNESEKSQCNSDKLRDGSASCCLFTFFPEMWTRQVARFTRQFCCLERTARDALLSAKRYQPILFISLPLQYLGQFLLVLEHLCVEPLSTFLPHNISRHTFSHVLRENDNRSQEKEPSRDFNILFYADGKMEKNIMRHFSRSRPASCTCFVTGSPFTSREKEWQVCVMCAEMGSHRWMVLTSSRVTFHCLLWTESKQSTHNCGRVTSNFFLPCRLHVDLGDKRGTCSYL